MADRDHLLRLQRQLADDGNLIEAGWVGFRLVAVPKDAGPVQLSEMKLAFFAGCNHLFSAIMSNLEEGAEPTEADLRRLSLIHEELDGWFHAFEASLKK